MMATRSTGKKGAEEGASEEGSWLKERSGSRNDVFLLLKSVFMQ
jgi:hypothetical protein